MRASMALKGWRMADGFGAAGVCGVGKGVALAGEIGVPGAVDDVEAPELDDEFGAVGVGDGVPTDVIVTFLEAYGDAAPAEDGDEFGKVGLGVGAIDSPPEDVSGGAPGLERIASIEGLPEVVDFGLLGGGAQSEVFNNEGRVGHQCCPGRLDVPKRG